MPTYDYVCDACGHEFELFQAMTDRVKRKCPKCEKPRLKRLIGAGAGVIFKGSGFHETDYRSDSYTKAAEAEKKAARGKTTKKADKAAKSKAKSSDSSSSSQSSSGSQSKDTD